MTAVLGVGHDGTAKHRTRRSTALGLRRSACGAFGEGVAARIAFAGATTRFAGWRGDVSAFPHPRATYPDDFIVERILPRLIAGADVDQRMQHVVQHLGSVDVHGIQQPSVPRSRALHGTPTRTPLPLNHARPVSHREKQNRPRAVPSSPRASWCSRRERRGGGWGVQRSVPLVLECFSNPKPKTQCERRDFSCYYLILLLTTHMYYVAFPALLLLRNHRTNFPVHPSARSNPSPDPHRRIASRIHACLQFLIAVSGVYQFLVRDDDSGHTSITSVTVMT